MSDHIAQAQAARERHTKLAVEIRDDPDLNDSARRRKLRDLERETGDELNQLRAGLNEERSKIERETRRHALGPVFRGDYNREAVLASYRAAEERVERAMERARGTDRQQAAVRLLSAADRNGDEQLARAVLATAWDSGWDAIVQEYLRMFPDAARDISELRAISATRRSKGVRLGESMFGFSVPGVPSKPQPDDKRGDLRLDLRRRAS